MNKTYKSKPVTASGICGFVLVWLGFGLFFAEVLGLILCVIGLKECFQGKKRGDGWPISGLIIGILVLIIYIGNWKSLIGLEVYWIMNASFLAITLLFYMLYKRWKKKKHAVTPTAHGTNPGPVNVANPASSNPAPSTPTNPPSAPSSIVSKLSRLQAKTPTAGRPDPETVRNNVKDRTEQLKEKLIEAEALRANEEEEKEQQRQMETSRRKAYRAKLLDDATAEPPAESDLLTLDGQRIIYKYAVKIFPQNPDFKAGAFLMNENIKDAEMMIETVSGVMEELSKRILESDGELKEHWKMLRQKDLIQGIKAFSFYKEMSVGSEPFEMITDELIDYLYNKSSADERRI